MGRVYRCHECGNETVLVSGCGIAHELLCNDCECQMHREDKRDTEFIGHSNENGNDSYALR